MRHDKQDRSVLEIALDVVMARRGSYERSADDQLRDYRELRRRMDAWKPSARPQDIDFDAAVWNVLEEALLMPDFWQIRQEKP